MEYSRPQVVWFHLTFDLSVMLTSTAAAAIVLLLAFLLSHKPSKLIPTTKQNILEWIIEFVQDIMKSNIGSSNNLFILSTGVALLIYLFISNLLGIPFTFVTAEETPISWWKSPTADAHVTMTLAIMIMAYTHFIDIRLHGIKHYLLSFFKPLKAIFIINVMEQFCTTLTLGLRLYGNIFAGEVMLALLADAVNHGVTAAILAAAPMLIWQGFSLFIGVIQSYIFVTLTMVYIAQRFTVEGGNNG